LEKPEDKEATVSEYQYYEWQTVDRLLTEDDQQAVRNLSSHIEVSSSRAVVTYAYGSFKHDPGQVLARFFDAHLYLANWGSRRLMFRFPSGPVSRDMIQPHCVQDRITFRTVNGFDVFDMDLSEEEGGGWIEGEGSLSGLISLRKPGGKSPRLWTSNRPRVTTKPFSCWSDWRSWPSSGDRRATTGRE
jgi:hypothetical protein